MSPVELFTTGQKPGNCPKQELGHCGILCNGDDECPGDTKCCFNGCGYDCFDPVP